MALTMQALGKLLYGSLFMAALPLALLGWAQATREVVKLPAVHSPEGGVLLVVVGALLMSAAFWALRVHGGGLPMNAFPPPRYVTRGVYAVLSQPIYVGFSAVVLGVALATGSASGLWLVWPVVTLAAVALYYGYEHHDLVRRVGALQRPWLAMPLPTDEPPAFRDRAFAWLCVGLPWVALYELVATVVPADPIATSLAFERDLPVIEWTEVFYISIYFVALVCPLVILTRQALRDLAVRTLLAMALVFPLYLAFPFVAPPRPFVPTTVLGRLLVHERALDTASCALPSFHVILALLFAAALAARRGAIGKWLAWSWGVAVVVSCLTTGMHTVLDVLAGAAAFLLVQHSRAVWESLRSSAERLANSWYELRVGSLRVINHGLYAALGTAVALVVVGAFAQSSPRSSLVLVWACTLFGAGAWAQWIEGASGLSRPFGYWGGVLGAVVGGVLAGSVGEDPWVILAATTVSAPFIQSLGRLRCLVQGCCHGSLAPAAVGIAHRHPRSRVAKLPELVGRPIYPTALFSILWNVVVALLVVRLAWLRCPAGLVAGCYLIYSGLGRFVEEAYRGEPQTPIVAGLRVYQWLSLAAVVAGALLTALVRAPSMPAPTLGWPVVGVALGLGAVNLLAFGVDFPESSRRLSRLA